jgi:hypothetical protein
MHYLLLICDTSSAVKTYVMRRKRAPSQPTPRMFSLCWIENGGALVQVPFAKRGTRMHTLCTMHSILKVKCETSLF